MQRHGGLPGCRADAPLHRQPFNPNPALLYVQVGILGCGMKGYPIVLMSPLHFIAKPTRWLDFMARHRTSHTVGPDFAFGLLTRYASRVEGPCTSQNAGLDFAFGLLTRCASVLKPCVNQIS